MLPQRIEHSMERMPAVADAGTRAARAIHSAVLQGGEPARQVADVLHGTWLGHPLHPVLTDITVGAWMLGAAFDAVGALTGDPFARRAGDRLATIGTASAVPTAITGLTDFSTVPKPSATPATLHALLNSAGLGLYVLSLRDRNSGNRRRGLVFSALALGLATASAWLGGEMVYNQRVGVDHSDPFSEPEDWTPVIGEAELPDRTPRCVHVQEKRILLYRDGAAIHAIGAVCGHAGGPLEQGDFDGAYVQCPWHQSVFDLRDGSVRHGPSTRPQPSFEARARDGQVEIRLSREWADGAGAQVRGA